MFGEGFTDFCQRSPGQCGKDKLVRIVFDNATQLREVDKGGILIKFAVRQGGFGSVAMGNDNT